jgi:deoxyribodipyrimidine photo-lyase
MSINIFLHHRDLRIIDNTTLIEQTKNELDIISIFIFTPEQINKKKNKYFSDASVQFMCESLHELSEDIKNKKGKLYFFKGDNLKVLKDIHKKIGINSIGWNIDYTPYAKQRDQNIKQWAINNNIKLYTKEDYVLYNILEGQTTKKDKTPYQIFTPFKNYCMENLKVREIDNFNKFNFSKSINLEKSKYHINENDIDNFYIYNPNINVRGGRDNGLKILNNINDFKDYTKKRDFLTYNTTFLGAHNQFSTISIREVFFKFYNNKGLINELHWRDFYTNIIYYFPKVLDGQINKKNKSFKEKYDKIKWSDNQTLWNKFINAQTGFPIIDASIKQLYTKNFMHNRCRMIVSMFLTKILHIDWREGEKWMATHLVDYSAIQNNSGWQWSSSTGTDSQPYFRIMNPWTQTEKYDSECEYIKTYIPELKNVSNNDILNYYKPEVYNRINYFKPIVDFSEERKKTIQIFKQI